jgi:hypothetical protein
MDDMWPDKVYTIKTGFKRFCTDPVLTQAIPGLVQSVTRAAFEGSRVANLYLLECLEHQPANNLNLGPFDQGFFYQVFSAISTGGREGPNQLRNFLAEDIRGSQLLATLQAVRDENLHLRHGVGAPQPAYASRQGCGQRFNCLSRQDLTNCQNHVAVNLERRVRGYLNYKMVNTAGRPRTRLPKFKKNGGGSTICIGLIVDFFYKCLAVNKTPPLLNWQSLLAPNPRMPALLGKDVLAAVCQAFWARCTSLFAKLVSRYGAIRATGALRDPTSNWSACFSLLRQILRSFE